MISGVSGTLKRIDENRASVELGAFLVELLVPAADVEQLGTMIGRELTFHTLLYLEGDPNRGNLEPRMIGFLRPEDKEFFELFTTVKGIGPKTALRALTVDVGQIAAAIESRDVRFLTSLDGIGKRTAELIVAELSGKSQRFAFERAGMPASLTSGRRAPEEEEAIALLVAGGERRADAEMLLLRARQLRPELVSADQLWQEMLRLRS
jgi:Holliday junction DNA helicase RuvA